MKLLGLMRGASKISGGDSPQYAALVGAYRADADAPGLGLRRGPGALLERLRRESTATGQALNDYLDFAGYRLLDGFDISNQYALDCPTYSCARSARRSTRQARTRTSTSRLPRSAATCREHREEFDSLLEEARLGYSVRDERGVYSDIWASGLMRRAALAAGRRLAARGRLQDAEHFVFADIDEMCAILDGAATPTAEDLAERNTYHRTYTAKDAPLHLGTRRHHAGPVAAAAADGPAHGRDRDGHGRDVRSLEEEHEDTVIRGLGASSGVRDGIARRVAGPTDFDRIQRGDVLLTEATTEAFNILLPLLSAIITDSGGALSHAAIVSREYGIPGVVGTRDATVQIADGTRVRVDGDAGTVTVLE